MELSRSCGETTQFRGAEREPDDQDAMLRRLIVEDMQQRIKAGIEEFGKGFHLPMSMRPRNGRPE
jgi:hypothetical protein